MASCSSEKIVCSFKCIYLGVPNGTMHLPTRFLVPRFLKEMGVATEDLINYSNLNNIVAVAAATMLFCFILSHPSVFFNYSFSPINLSWLDLG